MADKFVTECIKFHPRVGQNALNANASLDLYLDGLDVKTVDQLLAQLAQGGESILADRQAFAAALMEPVWQIVPYVTLYDRFFMTVQIEQGADNAVPVEDHLVAVAWSSHPQTSVYHIRPGYLFNRPTFTTWSTGIDMPWNTMAKAGWNVLSRQVNYATWELAKKRDAAAKTVIDAAIPTSHLLTVTGGMTKTSVDQVLRSSNQIGFPVKQALINPGRLMEMQSWTWGGTGFFISPSKSDELLENLYVSNYGNIKWYTSPYAPVNTIYFATEPEYIGWHQIKGTPRNDSSVDVRHGIDIYTFREAEHAYYAQSGLGLWSLTIA